MTTYWRLRGRVGFEQRFTGSWGRGMPSILVLCIPSKAQMGLSDPSMCPGLIFQGHQLHEFP